MLSHYSLSEHFRLSGQEKTITFQNGERNSYIEVDVFTLYGLSAQTNGTYKQHKSVTIRRNCDFLCLRSVVDNNFNMLMRIFACHSYCFKKAADSDRDFSFEPRS